MNKRSSRGWLWFLVAAATLSQATVHLVRPATTYKLVEFDAGGLTVGFITGIYALLPLVLALSVGARTQRAWSLKPFLVSGSFVLAVGVGFIAVANSILLVAVGSALLGLGQLIFTIAGQAVIARFASNSELDMAFGWFTAGFSAGQMIGPFVGGLTLSYSPGANLYAVDFTIWLGVLFALSSVALVQISGKGTYGQKPRDSKGRSPCPGINSESQKNQQRETEPREDSIGDQKPTVRNILRVPQIKSHLIASITMLAILDVLSAFLPLLAEDREVSPMWVGSLLAARAGASIISRLLLPQLRRRFTRAHLVITSLMVSGVTLVGATMAIDWLWLSLALFALAGFTLGMGQPLTMATITEAVPHTWHSPALALRLMGNRGGQVVVPIIAGSTAAPLGPAAAIWTSCLFLVASGTEKLISNRQA